MEIGFNSHILTQIWLSLSHLLSTLRAEFLARGEFGGAFGAVGGYLERGAAFGAEFGVGLQGGFAFGARCAYRLAPIFLGQFFVFLGHGGVRPYFLYRAACLRCGHLDAQIGCAIFAEAALGIPAFFAAYPLVASRALDEIVDDFAHRVGECLIVGALPGGVLDVVADVSGAAEYAAEYAARGVEGLGYAARKRRLEFRAVTGLASVAVELILEPRVGA